MYWCLEDVVGIVRELPILTPFSVINARSFSAQRRKRAFVGSFPLPSPADCKDVLKSKLRTGPYRIGPRTFGRKPVFNRSFAKETTLAACPSKKSPTILSLGSRRDAELAVLDDRLPGGLRQFEWQECASIQGFPDDYLFYGSATDVSKMVGRAIQIDTGRAILAAIAAKGR